LSERPRGTTLREEVSKFATYSDSLVVRFLLCFRQLLRV
jgi:hypothetical protein